MAQRPYELLILMAIALIGLILSGLNPFDRLTWFLEVLPVLIAVPLLVATYRNFPLTPLLYRLLLVHGIILMIGGHYTYARVPLGFWAADIFDLARNHYDRLGHFAQGFIPAILAREILLRRSPGPGEMALLPRDGGLSRFQRLLRIYRVVGGPSGRRIGGSLSWDPGRCLGYPVGHVFRAHRRRHGTDRAGPAPRRGVGPAEASLSRPMPARPAGQPPASE